MNFLDLLNKDIPILVEDSVEDGKTKKLIKQLNTDIVLAHEVHSSVKQFLASQTKGAYRKKIAVGKMLVEHYSDWKAVSVAYKNYFENAEQLKLATWDKTKNQIIKNLNTLKRLAAKSPLVCSYDLKDGELVKCEENHEIIILGFHNINILDALIEFFESLTFESNIEDVAKVALKADYSVVKTNTSICNDALNEFASKRGNAVKAEKLTEAINKMEELGKKVVVFYTFNDYLMEIGVPKKELVSYEQSLSKEYIPYKKLLEKTLKVKFEEICDLVVDEDSFPFAEY